MKIIKVKKIKSENGKYKYFHWCLYIFGREIILYSKWTGGKKVSIMGKELHRMGKKR